MRIPGLFTISAVLVLQSAPAPASPMSSTAFGLWRNPRGTVDVRIAPCGNELCGTIARASPEAERDAREAGVQHLVGLELLRNYEQVAPDRWTGRVYVPDMGGTFSSHMVQLSPGQLKISGCLVGGYFCKSQLWTRRR
jgi:uncharacterized protein (DUF2147 family)